MARLSDRLAQNVPGEFYVDSTCIDCETCMIVAPGTFAESSDSMSYVHTQPGTPEATHRALMALVSCPTSSIGTVHKVPGGKEAARAFPESIERAERARSGSAMRGGTSSERGSDGDDVFYCGYASENSYGASSYLVRRPEGNVLVDSPRAAAPLLDGIEKLGGVRWLFLTHRDDIADHEKLKRAFGCDRIIHEGDDVIGAERVIRGTEPVPLADDLTVIPTPGHTRGSAVLHWRGHVLFTGDHLWGDETGTHLAASRGVAWYSWREQTASMEKLLAYRFDRVLPGHGRPYRAASADIAHEELAGLVARMRVR